ncbi:hypothetical protein BU17DRAFT_65062 [Hysterangium stoloniferum]|nr:hypothetical protein BU17DRAFT_65062 [Hysterangium stoloniferum]
MPTYAGWTVNVRVDGVKLEESHRRVEQSNSGGTCCKCRIECRRDEVAFEISVQKPALDEFRYVISYELDSITHDETLLDHDDDEDISRGWSCSPEVFRKYTWRSNDYFCTFVGLVMVIPGVLMDSEGTQAKNTRIRRNVGAISVKIYRATSCHELDDEKFLEHPPKRRESGDGVKLKYYAGMGKYEKEIHPTRKTVGTVSNFNSDKHGPPLYKFRFEYFHNVLDKRATARQISINSLKKKRKARSDSDDSNDSGHEDTLDGLKAEHKILRKSVAELKAKMEGADIELSPNREKRARIGEPDASRTAVHTPIKLEDDTMDLLRQTTISARDRFLASIKGRLEALKPELSFLASLDVLDEEDLARKAEITSAIKILKPTLRTIMVDGEEVIDLT